MIIATMLRAGLAVLLLAGIWAPGASAQITGRDRYASIVVDHRTGNVLSAAQADEPRHPASLTKMMTLYMLFESMRDGRLNLSTPIRVSAEAASRPPSKLGIPAGGSLSTESAILSLITRSANDIAAAVAEALAGDEDNFARAMTQRARSLGMTRTTFRNASGLPDPEMITTARDMMTLGRRLISDFPDRYHYFSTTTFAHGNRMIRNHNGMLRDYPGVDGIKTGFINASGFNIVTSAQRDGVRLVGVVFGGSSWPQRNDHMAELLDDGFMRLGVRAPPSMASNPTPRIVAGRDATTGPGPRRLAAAPPRLATRAAVRNVSTAQPNPQPGARVRAPSNTSRMIPAARITPSQVAPSRVMPSRVMPSLAVPSLAVPSRAVPSGAPRPREAAPQRPAPNAPRGQRAQIRAPEAVPPRQQVARGGG